jgi:hypothetical protein
MASETSAVLFLELPTFDKAVSYGMAKTKETVEVLGAPAANDEIHLLRASLLPPPASMLLRASGACFAATDNVSGAVASMVLVVSHAYKYRFDTSAFFAPLSTCRGRDGLIGHVGNLGDGRT